MLNQQAIAFAHRQLDSNCYATDMDIGEIRRANLNRLVAKLGGQKELAEMLGVTTGYISQMQTGHRAIGEKTARKIEGAAKLSQGWMDIEHPGPDVNVEPGPDIRGKVPLISYVRAGSWDEAMDVFQPGDADDWLLCTKPHGPSTYALRVRGRSMTSPYPGEKSYPEGAIIFVDPEKKTPANGQRVIAKIKGSDDVTFKIFVQEEGKVWLKPINPQHPSIFDPFRVLGTVIGKWEDE